MTQSTSPCPPVDAPASGTIRLGLILGVAPDPTSTHATDNGDSPVAAVELGEQNLAFQLESVRPIDANGSALYQIELSGLIRPPHEPRRFERISEKEKKVLQLMAEGRSNQAISKDLFISVKTVETHVASIFSKLYLPVSVNDHRRVLAVLYYLQDRLASAGKVSTDVNQG